MKKIVGVFLALISLQSFAGLIAFEPNITGTISAGQQVVVDVVINDLNPEVAELEFDLLFDDSLFTFDSFEFSDDVFFTAFLTDSQYLGSGQLNLFSIWFDASELPGSNFVFGQLALTANSEATAALSSQLIFAGDVTGAPVANPQQVSEPNVLMIFAMLMALLSMTIIKRKSS